MVLEVALSFDKSLGFDDLSKTPFKPAFSTICLMAAAFCAGVVNLSLKFLKIV
jgi:hypothetical protein